MKNKLVKKAVQTPLEKSAEDYAFASVRESLTRAPDIRRDKERAVNSFFALIKREPDEITTADVRSWSQDMRDRGLSENYIYASMSHLSKYFEWLRSLPEFSHFIKTNPVRVAMPRAPKKYNSPKAKSLTDTELSKLWVYVETAAADDTNLPAVRDYAIFRMFMATGMRREEVLSLNSNDVKIEDAAILIHGLVKGGHYEWRTVTDGEVKDTLERYLRLAKRRTLIGQENRALWIRFDRGAKIAEYERKKEDVFRREPRLSSHSFDKQIKLYARKAGIGAFHIHQLRHTFARIVSEETGSLIETQDALGHRDLQTTQIYVSRIRFKKDKYSVAVSERIRGVVRDSEKENY